jgi:hypothetical protein
VTPRVGGNSYRFPEEPGHQGRAARHRPYGMGVAGRGDETTVYGVLGDLKSLLPAR